MTPIARDAAVITFWGASFLVIYAYLIYPLLLWLVASWRPVRRPPAMVDSDLPSVSVLVAAHNEEAVIRARLENMLALDYPASKLELVVASDGSRDRTNDIVREFAPRVGLIAFENNGGKAAALDASIPRLKGEVVVLSDANTMMRTDAVRRLAEWFSDREIGVVCGKLVLTDAETGANVDGLYWRYETFLKRCEAKLGGLLGANGAIYAIRKKLFPGIEPGTIVDDFVIPLVARIRSGCRIVYDEQAIAYEETPAEVGMEFRRRTRIGAGDFQSLGFVWPLLNPAKGWVCFTFVSHKLLRWLCPFLLLAIAAANVVLVDRGFYGLCLLLQCGLYGVALLGRFIAMQNGVGKIVRLATMFAAMNAALLVGFFKWATERQQGAWERTAR